ncbi:MAG: formate--phosphoribosylaminoimidazolecarboxamide ligase [Candidatus Thermoplasmatota archaeon]|nr:formate--phosphoribosylaminoimidazolecarboxamide ligase [Euryarchaeota archaeon]MBU4031307.1 formate--phosphoribosylaminoimidazolecarboxamide ligase [Candidatus Thermoplasmatota archaeon]MBU4070622.1 formate--phosphoribosylaminoimidazolecarboxamide ligase [Candidatus Thermoplasmatota archaeon]MBU4145037.1 formate--phosphoribosylaminoimidazolecarboxamide ligase [Candidatus Thermoplasmatota archaeon]MBU4590956.1 formate--phosphoribosylaminoimidazolecarboxamide ligase [Candidatus Thermoplasmato
MVSKSEIMSILSGYDPENITIATVCSHSSLQIFAGARKEGFKTLGIAIGKAPKFYDAFPLAKPDEFFVVEKYEDIIARADELAKKNVILIPHGSFVEYLGATRFAEIPLPTFGNRNVLEWESNRDIEREWLTSAGLRMPDLIKDPRDIDRPVLVKYHGAKGGRGFFIAKDFKDFKMGIDLSQKFNIQEYILGTRYYLHYFYSPIKKDGYKLSKGTLELMGMDRRDETNIDEIYKLGAQEELKRLDIYPSFVVTGNIPLVIRESLLPKVFAMGEQVVERSIELFGGMIGPFCLETIVNDKLEFYVFEISGRIVAGTNLNVSGSPYSDMIEPGMSTGQRIARELKDAIKLGKLEEIVS